MIKLPRRGQAMYYIIIAGFALAVVSYWLFLHLSTPDTVQGETGTLALGVVRASQLTERMSLYVDHAAVLAADRAVVDTGESGGFTDSSLCGFYFGYPIWSDFCVGDAPAMFENAFNQHLTNLLSTENYPEQAKYLPWPEPIFDDLLLFFPELPSTEYNLFVRGHDLVGSNSEPLRVGIYQGNPAQRGQGRVKIGEYVSRADFHATSHADLDLLFDFQSHAEVLTQFGATSQNDVKDILLNPGWESELDWNVGACVSETAAELFWEVVEQVQDCMRTPIDSAAVSTTCNCDVSRTDLSLLEEKYAIVFEEKGLKWEASLKDKENDWKLKEHHVFEDAVPFGLDDLEEEFSPSELRRVTEIFLEWDGENIVKKPSFMRNQPGDQGVLTPIGGMFRYKFDNKNLVAFISDASRTEQYEHFSVCNSPSKQKLRLCAIGGEIPVYNQENKQRKEEPVKFKLAIDLQS
jgi:hypothetical protein